MASDSEKARRLFAGCSRWLRGNDGREGVCSTASSDAANAAADRQHTPIAREIGQCS
jgi:hypothetical protein